MNPGPVAHKNPIPAIDTAEIAKKVRGAITEGDVYYEDGDYDRAIAAYQAGLAAGPGNAQLTQKIEKAKKAKATEASTPQ